MIFRRKKPLHNNLKEKLVFLQLAAIANEECIDAWIEAMKARMHHNYRLAANMTARAKDLDVDAQYYERMAAR